MTNSEALNGPATPPSTPTNWPTDKLSTSFERDGFYCLRHPQRAPHKYDPETNRWSPI